MDDYKLVVIAAFNDYKRGDQILDPLIVNKILNLGDPMNEHEQKCRKVFKSAVERQLYVAPVPENAPPVQAPQREKLEHIEVESSDPLHIESINFNAINE